VKARRSDRRLALLPEEHLFGFDRLPFEEQKWRARVFLMTYSNTGGKPSLPDDPRMRG
jgi:hypothetical protein